MSIAIIIPVFDRFEFMPLLLGQLSGQSLLPTTVIIVDHGRQSFSLKGNWPFAVELLKRESSLWFAAATNEGLNHARKANYDYLMILNDDVRIECRHWLSRLRDIASEQDTMVASSAVDGAGHVLYAGVKFSRLRFGYLSVGRGRPYGEIGKTPVECDVLPTRGIMLRSGLLDRIGLLDDQVLPHHASDYEWTARARRNGIRLLMARDAVVVTAIAAPQRNRAKTVASEINDYFCNQYLKGSFPVARAYSKKVFHQPYRCCFLAAHFTRFLMKCAKRRFQQVRIRGLGPESNRET